MYIFLLCTFIAYTDKYANIDLPLLCYEPEVLCELCTTLEIIWFTYYRYTKSHAVNWLLSKFLRYLLIHLKLLSGTEQR